MLKQRLITALVLIPLFIWGVLRLPSAYLAAILGAIVLLGAWEWSKLFPWTQRFRSIFLAVAAAGLVGGYQIASSQVGLSVILWIAFCWWVFAFAWVVRARRQHADTVDSSEKLDERTTIATGCSAAIGWMVLLPSFVALVALHSSETLGPGYTLFCLTLMWVADSGAYFSGRQWGRRKLAPWVSPGKSWEGVAGGGLLSGVWAVVGGIALGLEWQQIVFFVLLSLVTVGFSIIGDLFESMFKRLARVKDSGQLLPGHGGVLDRIDSVTAGAPIFLLGLGLFV